MREFLQAVFGDIADEEIEAGAKLRDLCIQNELEVPEQLMTLQYFSGIDSKLIITKINAVNTPLLENAMHVIH